MCGAQHGIAKILVYAGRDVSDGDYYRCHACGATHTPKDDGSLRKGGKYYSEPATNTSSSFISPQPARSQRVNVIAQPQFISHEVFTHSLHYGTTNTLAQFLIQTFGEKMRNHLALWCIGGDVWGGTIFHYFDTDFQHINAKSVLYNTHGKRIKTGFRVPFSNDDIKEYPFIFGIRTRFNAENNSSYCTFFTRKRGFSQCLYGLWHLSEKPDAVIILCESEKTSLIGSFVMPEFCWIATGGTNGLTQEKAIALVGKRVLVCFDSDEAGITKTEAATKLLRLMDIEAVGDVDGTPLALHLFDTETRDGYDLADYFIEQQILRNKELNNDTEAISLSKEPDTIRLSEDIIFWRKCFSDGTILSTQDLIIRAALSEKIPNFTSQADNLSTQNLSAQEQTRWLNRIHQAVYAGYLVETMPHHFALHPIIKTGGQSV